MDQWENLRFQSEIAEGPEIQPITYTIDRILGCAFDDTNHTKITNGLAIVGDQLSMVTDLILEKGITQSSKVNGAIQRKGAYVRPWLEAYELYRAKFNQQANMRKTLGDPYRDAWDSWPERHGNMTMRV